MLGRMSNRKRLVIIFTLVLTVGLTVLGWWVIFRPKAAPVAPAASRPLAGLPAVKDFTVYRLSAAVSDYQIVDSSARYEQGVLLFTIASLDQTYQLQVAEQATPDDLQLAQPQANESVPTPNGKAALSLLSDRTTVVLLTDRQTMITVNAGVEVPIEDLKTIIRSLEPVRP